MMNATTQISKMISNDSNEKNEQNDSKIKTCENEFFNGLIQRALFYEQFEERQIKLTCSFTQTDIGAFTA